jgi:hypothetical protein
MRGPPSLCAHSMAVLTRHARLLYVLALFQLLGGPLVLGGLMMVTRLMGDREMTLSQSVSMTLGHLHASINSEADAQAWTDGTDVLPPAKPESPRPRKLKDGKDKIWLVSDFLPFVRLCPGPLKTCMGDWHDPVPRRLANAPPLPPPRWS